MAAINWPVAIISIYLVSKLLGTAPYDQPLPDPNVPSYPVGSESIPASSVLGAESSSAQAPSTEGGD